MCLHQTAEGDLEPWSFSLRSLFPFVNCGVGRGAGLRVGVLRVNDWDRSGDGTKHKAENPG